jgi:lysozyme family protein
MSPRFRRAFAVVHGHEGGFVDHPRDPGGATNHGISLRYARSKGRLVDLDQDGDVDADDIRLVTPEVAQSLYHMDFWRPIRGDELPPALALIAFDAAINNGTSQAVRWMQAAAAVRVDGQLGPLSMQALTSLPPLALAQRVHDRRLELMTDLDTWPAFGRGWARRLAALPFQAVAFAEAEARVA